jgi:outer membrane protein assembly factor BamB
MSRHAAFTPALLAVLGSCALAGDWPAGGHDAQRSSKTDEALSFPMRMEWRYVSPQPPRVAWPEPVKVLNRLDFDYAPQPVVARGIVCFGSSADDTIRALDVNTGAEKWHFTTGGPVRFAPHIADEKVYAAADDGYAYCLDAATGKSVWTFRAAPADERMLGNERMISRWPCRTGVLVADGVAYTTAGMWSSSGVYVYALDAATGRVLWCNDTSGIVDKVRTLHVESATDATSSDFGTYGVCPQGLLAASGDILLVPTGKGLPAAYDRKSGKLIYYALDPVNNTAGGSALTIDGNRVFFNSAQTGGLFALDVATGQHDPRQHRFYDREIAALFKPALGRAYTVHDQGKVSALVLDGKPWFRMAYALAAAADRIIAGEANAVVALKSDTKEEIWRADVGGEARGLAIADGRLIVSTHRGEISCFVPGQGSTPNTPRPPVMHGAASPTSPESAVSQSLIKTGVDRGYALLLGDADGRFSLALARETQLHIVNVLAHDKAPLLREKLLATTALYGSRIEVHEVEKFDRLPFAQYFANAIVVAETAPGLSGKELYRLLRPCGGVLTLPGLKRAAADALVQQTGAPAAERQAAGQQLGIVRGPLVGARDWNTGAMQDQRVKWPLELLWFGGPGPAMVLDRKAGNVIGPVANGRYFVFGDDLLTAVDAYNGCVLWSRPIPRVAALLPYADEHTFIAGAEQAWRSPLSRTLSVDADHAYLTLGGYFRGEPPAKTVIQLDARTGGQQKIYGPYVAPERVSLTTPQKWPLEIDAAHSGSVALRAAHDGLVLDLTTKDPNVTPLDGWDLFFDFRPFDQRYGLYEKGVLHEQIPLAQRAKTVAMRLTAPAPAHPALSISETHDAEGTTTTIRLSWAEIERLTGARPDSFGFAVTLSSFDGKPQEKVAQKYLFSDLLADGLNNGWANVEWGAAATARTPAIIVGALSDMPKPPPAKAPLAPSLSAKLTPRIHPLTGEREGKFYQTGSFGCGGIAQSDFCAIARSTALSIYDFADDSGTRHFDGTKPSCTGSMTAALGLILSSEGRGGCECTTNFQTSLALAPAEKRSNEDWALYYDRDVDSRVRQAAINFGAPGDRRAGDGTLWLGFPRVGGKMIGFPLRSDGKTLTGSGIFSERIPPLRVPLELEMFEGFGPYRVNADRVPIAGTETPWVYASGCAGIRKATMKLNFGQSLVSQPLTAPPALDGKLSGPAWAGEPDALLPGTKTKLFLRHDAEHLYLAATRAVVSRLGKVDQWPMTAAAETPAFFKSESYEFFLSDAAGARVVHLAVNPAGSRYDALSNATAEDAAWSLDWKSAAVADDSGFAVELAIPWKTLAAAGVVKESLAVNVQVNTNFPYGYGLRSEALRYLGPDGRDRCEYFIPLGLGAPPPPPGERQFKVRLHFAELEDTKPGTRVFDVRLQGQTVLKDFDIAKTVGVRTALMKEFRGVKAGDAVTLEFVPKSKVLTPATAPILSGLELMEEGFTPTVAVRKAE